MPEKPDKLRPALFGGLTIAIVSTIPVLNFINCFCCAGVILGGLLSVYFYNKSQIGLGDASSLNDGDGIILGLMSGAFGAIIGTIFSSIIGTNLQQQLEKIMEYSSELPPEVNDALDMLSQHQEGIALIVLGLFISLIIDCLFGILGGILGVSLLAKKKIG